MVDRHKPRDDYQRQYQKARRIADACLRGKYTEEWYGYFDAARTDLTPEQRQQRAEQRARDYKLTREVGERIMARPGFMEMVDAQRAEIDRRRDEEAKR